MQESNLLSIKDLSIDFTSQGQSKNVLERVSLDIKYGEIVGLVGESGSGKTVTSLSIMRLLPSAVTSIKSGEIVFNVEGLFSKDILKLSEKQMQENRGRHIGMIFQEPMSSLNPVMKCGKQVAETMLWHKVVHKNQVNKKVLELFEDVKLPETLRIYNSYPHELSGGQRQRVMIAMAISCNPHLLIADEPTTALDVTVQNQILELIKELQKKYKMSILFITHDLGVVSTIADKICVMYNGSIVETGDVNSVFNNPKHPYTKGLLKCRPNISIRPEKLPIIQDFMDGNNFNQGTGDKLFSEESLNKTAKERIKRHDLIYSKDPVLIVENLKTSFITESNFFGKPKKTYDAVDNISFSVYEGETLGLVGESGCGKTTLGRTILRLIDPNEGKIVFRGLDLSQFSSKALRKFRPRMQIVFQDPFSSLTPGIQVGKAIQEPLKVHRLLKSENERRKRVVELLEKVGLSEKHYDRYPHEFSGGQRQRICIARALATNPEFLICDESVSSLDVSVQAQILNLLNELKKEFNLTYIFISHDLSVVKYMSDRVMVMKNGKIIELGKADELYSKPKSDYTKALIDSIPEIRV